MAKSFNKKSIYTDFVEASELIADLLEKKEIKKAVTRSNLYKFWEKTAGAKFSGKSRPYSMTGSVMIIACANTVVAQELVLQKSRLLEKLQPYLKSLKMNVTDLKFDAKKWS
ncbi:MAG: DUF721 domain-containing protein [Heliobacteriaceae bacterium]|jgi:hypothetical protein|nr:DUF721 domain-containing protein [Heliobacteriaceae bacterium]